MEEKRRCAVLVYHGKMATSSPCARNAAFFEDDEWWCKQHAPSSVMKRCYLDTDPSLQPCSQKRIGGCGARRMRRASC